MMSAGIPTESTDRQTDGRMDGRTDGGQKRVKDEQQHIIYNDFIHSYLLSHRLLHGNESAKILLTQNS